MASYRYERDIDPKDIAPRKERQYTRKERWANWWDYNLKWVILIGIFCGMVLGLQGYYTLVQFGSVGMLGSAVSLSLIRELGPVLTAIMLAGRAGSSMAAEIGVMRISDQIDALDVMDINSMAYLVSGSYNPFLYFRF